MSANAAVHAVQDSVQNLFEAVDQAARGKSAEELAELHDEIQRLVLMMMAAIVLADSQYDAAEKAFMNLLVDSSKKAGGESRFLEEYAERWKTASMRVPQFFQAAVEHDLRCHTDLAREMIRQIQFIGNTVCITDGDFNPSEHNVVQNYILFLREYLKAWRLQDS